LGGELNRTHFSLDFRSGAPIYQQIVEQVRGWIAARQLGPGDQLPTVRQLADELRVNFNTVARAYRILDEAQIISTQQGRGTYILPDSEPGIDALVRKAELDDLARDYVSSARHLGYAEGDMESAIQKALYPEQNPL
jgi:GntR family transcriptional regulator